MGKKEKVINRLCDLVTEVGIKQFKSRLAHDCFCNESVVSDEYFNCDNEVLEFIETAVRNAINQ